MSIFIFTAIIILIFFPLIYFMWTSFISMMYWQWKWRKMSDEEREQMLGGPFQEAARPEPKTRRTPTQTGMYNFITADEFITDLNKPDLPARRLHRILRELSASNGVIKRQQQADLRRVLESVQERVPHDCEDELELMVKEALVKLDNARIID